jgi:hypothetical protein
MLKISETVQGFLTRVRIAANFAQLTRPNGSPVWINGSAVSSLFAPGPNEYIAGVNAVVVTGALTQGMQEGKRQGRMIHEGHRGPFRVHQQPV